jgi:hypothetical protein
MTANRVARLVRVRIGTDLQDWSTSVNQFTFGYDSLSESGLVLTKGNLSILEMEGNPESVDPKINPNRWRPGQLVTIDGLDSAGLWAPIGIFRVLQVPNLPSDGMLTLALGCALTWVKQKVFEDDQSQVTIGVGTPSHEVASTLLQAAGIPAANISLSGWSYTLDYPLVKEDENAFVDQAAKLAWANNCRFLYQDNLGAIRNGQWTPESIFGGPLHTIILGTNDSVFEPLTDPVQPVEAVRISGVGFQVYELPPSYTQTATIVDAAANYSEDRQGTVTLITQTTNWWEETPALLEGRSVLIVQPETNTFVLGDSSSGTAMWVINHRVYDQVTKLLSVERETTLQSVRTQVGPGTSWRGSRITNRKTTNFEYNDKEVLVGRLTTTEATRISVDDGAVEGTWMDMIPVNTSETTWIEERPNKWTERTWTRTAARKGKASGARRSALVAQLPEVKSDSSPPASERWLDKFSLEEQQYSAQVAWDYPGFPTGLNRNRTYIVEPGFSNEQCFTIATSEVALLEQRSNGYLVESPLVDSLLWARPLAPIEVNDGSNLWTIQLDALSWTYGDGVAFVGGIGLPSARVPLATPTPDARFPVLPVLTSGLVANQVSPPEPPVLQPPPSNFEPIDDYEGVPMDTYEDSPLFAYTPDVPTLLP